MLVAAIFKATENVELSLYFTQIINLRYDHGPVFYIAGFYFLCDPFPGVSNTGHTLP